MSNIPPRPNLRAGESLRAALAAGRWPVLSRLPGEHHLADEFGVARGTIRRALTQLTNQGLLIRKPHAGFLVAPGGGGNGGNGGSNGTLTNAVVLVSDLMLGEIPVAEEFPSGALIGAQRRAAQTGIHLLLISHHGWDVATQEGVAAHQPAAVILADYIDDEGSLSVSRALFDRAGIPLICHADLDDMTVGDCAAADQIDGARQLVAFCRQRQRTRPLLLETVKEKKSWWCRRRDAILAAWKLDGITGRTMSIDIEGRRDQRDDANFNRRMRIYAGYIAEEIATGRRPDAIFVSSDSDVGPVTAACRLLGLDPTCDVDVVGFDGYWQRTWERDIEALAPAATIRANHLEVGVRLFDLAVRQDRASIPRLAQRVGVDLILRL